VSLDAGPAVRLAAVLKKKWVKRTLTIAVYVLLAGFLIWAVYDIQWSALTKVTFDVGFLAIAFVAGLGFRYWQTFIWITVLRGLGASKVRMNRELIYVYAKSWLGRYIPGTAPWILGKIFFASRHGVSKTKLAVGSLLEAAIQIAVLLSTSAIMLLFDARLSIPSVAYLRPIMVVVIIVCVIGLLPPVFNRLMSVAFRILRRPRLERENYATWRTIGIASAQYVVGMLLSGISLYCMALSIYPQLGFDNFFYVVAAGNLSGAVSMLIVFLPSGIGVRDGMQLVFLRVVMPGAIAAAVVVITRVWTLVLDLVFFAVSWLILVISHGINGTTSIGSEPAPVETAAVGGVENHSVTTGDHHS
jgi:uncharacterized membrane protein YbhN (UPF0104 family)